MGRENKNLIGLAILVPGLLLASGCENESTVYTQVPTQEPTQEPWVQPNDETLQLLKETKAEVVRLLDNYPDNSIIKRIYLDNNLTDFNSIFVNPVGIGIADPNVAYARTKYGITEYSPEKRFVYYWEVDGSLADYATLETMELSVYFSPTWLNSQSDRVKQLALEKEAYTIAQWSGFSMIALSSYQTQGEIELIDPEVTEFEVANTLARNLLIENPDVLKLYDYAAYLLLMERAGEVVNTGTEQEIEELKYSNIFNIYVRALEAGVDFKDMVFGSEKYYGTAFNPGGAWGRMILDPEVPGPDPLPLDELPDKRSIDTVASNVHDVSLDSA